MPSKNSAGGTAGSGHPSAVEAGPAATVSPRSGDLKTRVISALILGPPVLAAAWVGGVLFVAVILLVIVLAAREWVRLAEPGDQRRPLMLGLPAALLPVVVYLVGDMTAALIAAAIATLLLWLIARVSGMEHARSMALTAPYVGVSCLALLWLRNGTGDDGRALFFFLLLVIWATDVGAYAFGRTIGGPKLAPRFSPKKTWAGLIGGMISAAAVAYGVAYLAGAAQPVTAALIGAALAVVGQVGDLFESHMKRRSDVKDSGTLIPGHGGILDRIDGLIAAAPVFALIHAVAGQGGAWW